MQLSIKREDILDPLQRISGVVERRQTKPVLSNFLFKGSEQNLSITATDLEVELVSSLEVELQNDDNATIPAHKLLDICRSLPEQAQIEINSSGEGIKVSSGRSHFLLATLPAEDFPIIEDIELDEAISVSQKELHDLVEKTAFAMAQQDVRYYLNGLLLEVDKQQIKMVATDGHRLALSQISHSSDLSEARRIIIPRKGVQELQRLLAYEDDQIMVSLGKNHLQISLSNFQLTSKLIDGRFPEYQRVLPSEEGNHVTIQKDIFRQALTRVSILSNDKYRGVQLTLNNDMMLIQAHNPEHEEAEEEIEVGYKGEKLEVGFNVAYLLDVLNVLKSETVEIYIKDANSSALILPGVSAEDESSDRHESRYVIMPMRL